MIIAYRYVFIPLAMLLLPFAGLFNRKLAEGLRLRRQKRVFPEFHARPLWIHAASGEFEYAKSLIRECKERWPRIPIMVTYFSPTYARNVQNFPGVDYAQPLPLDLPGPVASFLKRTQPRALLLARTDFWPELLTQCRARGIPIWVFSYTQKDPARMGWFAKRIARWRLSLADRIFAVSLEDEANIQKLRVKTPVRLAGDSRYDQVRFRLDHPKELPARLKPPEAVPCLVAGSTWAEDEAVLFPAVAERLKTGRLKMILAPHEPTPEHIESLKRQLQGLEIPYALFSSAEAWGDAGVLLVDQVGWLAELYAWGDMAFVGGSFRKTVHSVMEPLGAGLLTFVGPLHLNNREAIDFQKIRAADITAVKQVRDAEEWRREIAALAPADFANFKRELLKIFAAQLGATKTLADEVSRLID